MRATCCLLTLLPMLGCYDSGVILGGDGEDHADARPEVGADADADTEADAEADAEAEAEVTPACPPASDGVWADFTVDGTVMAEANLDLACLVDSVIEDSAGAVRINLGCGTGGIIESHSLELTASPGPWLFGLDGLEVRFRYAADPVWWTNRWFSLRDVSGDVMVAGVSADALAPPAFTPNEWFAPANVDLRTGVCPPTDDSCGPLERLALQVAYHGGTGLVFDGTAVAVGDLLSLHVVVGSATRYLEVFCEDMPQQFFHVLMFGLPDG
ncbi:MAG: hypothetical protein JXB32_13840 [Deltaproteobacteria bacterium]|nr:hypothetical protein [Deltaproteobacteria bacterium]